MAILNQSFWEQRYQQSKTGWDIGNISQPLKAYFDQLTDKKLRILIPGCGNAYEAQYLFEQGFTNVHLLDWSTMALQNFSERVPQFPSAQLLEQDFFEHAPKDTDCYNLIIEQTFFCALAPELRPKYIKHMHRLLQKGGKLVGLLFNSSFDKQGPPFGGNANVYRPLFSPYFDLKTMEVCHNSISPRANNELFINFGKKENL